MNGQNEKQPLRDRTYQEIINGDYMDNKQYLVVAVLLCVTHSLMEIFYIWVGCTPMVYINIVSILSYVVSIVLVLKNRQLMTVWIMEGEIFWHVIFACTFMGLACGYQLWLFGTFSSIFLPFFIPNLSKKPKAQIGVFALVIIMAFEILVFLDVKNLLPTKYRPDDSIASMLFYVNALLAFVSIMIYTAIYNQRMSMKNKELQHLAEHDALTGIYNRSKIQSILEAEILRKTEKSGGNLSIAILDIDFFKKINDTYGHLAGDDAIIGLTDCLKEYCDKGLLYGRMGGEEFLLISPENITYDEFIKLLEDLRNTIQNLDFKSGDRTFHITVSMGAAAYTEGLNVDKLLQMADERLYIAKDSGRNKVVS